MNELQRFAMMLEDFLIEPPKWPSSGASDAFLILAAVESNAGVPTGIAKHPEHGFFVLQTSGQGPYIIKSELDDEALAKVVAEWVVNQ